MSIFVHSWNFPFKPIHEVWCLSSLRLIRRITRMFWWRLCESRSWKPWIFSVVPVQVHFLIVFQRRQLLRIEHFLNAVLRYPSLLFYVAILLNKSCILLDFRRIIVLALKWLIFLPGSCKRIQLLFVCFVSFYWIIFWNVSLFNAGLLG